ncbi:hypothetical protein Tco_1267326 [Tanacetum coccineum]
MLIVPVCRTTDVYHVGLGMLRNVLIDNKQINSYGYIDLSSLEGPGSVNAGKPSEPPTTKFVPREATASVCFTTGLVHLEQNQLPNALYYLGEAFLALAKDNSCGADIKAQTTICAQYKITITLLHVNLLPYYTFYEDS